MSLSDEITRLLELKSRSDQAEADYETQRLVVRAALDDANLDTVEQDGYRVTSTDERTVRTFDLDLLREQLAARGLSPESIRKILEDSKSESTHKGVLRITPLNKG